MRSKRNAHMTISLEHFLAIVVLTFAEYRISLFIAEDVGPWRIAEQFRELFPDGWKRYGVECVGCVGVSVSLIVALGLAIVGMTDYPALIWLACAGGICFINRLAPCP